jgi:hypothetical protein
MLKTNLERLRSIRARSLTIVQGFSQEQIDYSPASDTWSIGEVVDHLILSEKITRGDIAELIALTKASREPVLYRLSCTLLWLEAPLNIFNMFMPEGIREYIVRNVPVRATPTPIVWRPSGASTPAHSVAA